LRRVALWFGLRPHVAGGGLFPCKVPPLNLSLGLAATLLNHVIEVPAMNAKTFDALLEEIEALPVERQETLAEILRHRLAEKRRKEIARNAREARELFEKGQLPCGSVDELMRDLGAGET